MSDFRDKQARDYFNSGVIKLNSMQYAEAILYDGILSATNQTIVRNFLNNKWAVY